MAVIQVHDKQFELFIHRETIQQRIVELAQAIDTDCKGLDPLFIGILNGSFMFAADLFKHIAVPCAISFVKLASYKGTTSSGSVTTAISLEENIQDRHVIILEDIIDTGKTLASFLPQLQSQNPASVKIVALLSKPAARQHDIQVDYTGFDIPDSFVVGYGLDYDGYGRNLPDIYTLCRD
jgi:hypoxanthine phosphoribosyltransferase